jgi:hypothetical protein
MTEADCGENVVENGGREGMCDGAAEAEGADMLLVYWLAGRLAEPLLL